MLFVDDTPLVHLVIGSASRVDAELRTRPMAVFPVPDRSCSATFSASSAASGPKACTPNSTFISSARRVVT